jgi:hypothetical protein
MTLKVLLLNFPVTGILQTASSVRVTTLSIETNPTLHDFHATLIDTDEILNPSWWAQFSTNEIGSRNYSEDDIHAFSGRVKEQIMTGGLVFSLCNSAKIVNFITLVGGFAHRIPVMNYFFCPIDLGIISEKGDTFYPKSEELRYFVPLLKQIPKEDINWGCYFSKIPEKARVIGVNRAGYAVFLEVPLGAGKLVMLPHFKNKLQAATIIINEIIPRIIAEEDFSFSPQWLNSFVFPLEQNLRENLSEIEKAKRLLYTKDRVLKKAVAFAFEKIGFSVEILPDGTLPDLRLRDDKHLGMVEVKGHENKQGAREDVSQVLSYMSETDVAEKGLVVINPQFNEEPCKRNATAFTPAAIQLAEKIDVSLISSVELSNIVMRVLEGKLGATALKEIRQKILNGRGIVKLSE